MKETEPPAPIVDLRQKINEKKSQQKAADDKQADHRNKQSPTIVDELNDIMDKKHDEDALDFEAEDGECADEKDEKPADTKEPENKSKKDSDGEIEVSVVGNLRFLLCILVDGKLCMCVLCIGW